MKLAARSLRARLVQIVFSATLLVWVAAGFESYHTALHQVDELLDGQMAQSAKLLMAQVHHEEKELYQGGMVTQVLAEITLSPYEQPIEFQVWDTRGQLLLRSAGAPAMAMAMARQRGFADIVHYQQSWRTFTINTVGSQYQVQTAQRLADRHQAALTVATRSAIPMLLALPLLGMIIYWGVRRGLKPLEDLAGAMNARDPEHLQALNLPLPPRELRPLVNALNALMARLDTALNNERRFTADAAHELRTPLAAIKVHAQVALSSQDDNDCRHALSQVSAGADRAGRLVEQLLRLARLDPMRGLSDPGPVDLARLVHQEAENSLPAADEAGLTLDAQVPDGPITIAGDADMLALALRNLLENAVRYTPPGGTVRIGAEHGAEGSRLWVRDNGPGVPAEELPRLVERFYRGGDVMVEGSGLGLAIVHRVAELHGARLAVENRPEGGFQASLTFPSMPSP